MCIIKLLIYLFIYFECREHSPDKSILQVFRKLKFNVFKGSEKSKIFHSTFIPVLLLYYIAIFKGDIFSRHCN